MSVKYHVVQYGKPVKCTPLQTLYSTRLSAEAIFKETNLKLVFFFCGIKGTY